MSPYFPWRLFRKFFIGLMMTMIVTCCLALLLFASFHHQEQPFDYNVFGVILIAFTVVSFFSSLWFSYRFTDPLSQVIMQASRLASKKNSAEISEEMAMFSEEPGEYYELERALLKIKKKMKKRRIQLAQEREESMALMSAIVDAIVSIDKEEKLKFFNSRFATKFLTRQQLGEAEMSLSLTQVFRDPVVLDQFRKSLNSGDVLTQSISHQENVDTEIRYYTFTTSPLTNEKTKEVYGVLGLFQDVTDVKKVEKVRMEFVQNASHELRTPLTSIRGYVETLREDVAAKRFDQAEQFLHTIGKGVKRLTELVEDMLTLSSLESAVTARHESLTIEDITHEILEGLAAVAKEKQIRVRAHFDCKSIQGDRKQVEQVLLNLVGNAIKYTQPGGNVDVSWEEKTHSIFLRVTDNGPGIATEHLPRLFERFYRVDKGRSRDVGGTGLGLAIVKHIMHNHEGSVSVRSQIGKGSEFICQFPKQRG